MLSTTFPSGAKTLKLEEKPYPPSHKAAFSRIGIVMAAYFAASASFGAQVEPHEYERLLKEATATGTVRVLVSIDNTITQANLLLAELGPDALESGYWNNGLGQIGVYVTSNGLKILANSDNAKSFMPDATSKMRFVVNDSDGSIDAIETIINANSFADVEVFLNVDEGYYDIGRDGKTTFRPSPELSNAIMTRLTNINAATFASGFKNFDKSPTEAAIPNPSFRARIDKNTFYGLRESRDVRAIRLIGFIDARPAQWPADALEAAKTNGKAEVGIQLRGGSIYSPKTGYMSAGAIEAQANANQRAFEDILSNAGASLSSLDVTTSFALGSISGVLSYNTLARLYENADPRILAINLNKAAGSFTSAKNTTPLAETNQVFTKPWQHCFKQNELRGQLNQTTFDHYLVIPENDQFKKGDVFVGFRLKSRPNDLWLYQYSGKWIAYNGSTDPEAYYRNWQELTPVMKIPIFSQPTDLSAFSGDGELLVGYGLRNSATSTIKDSFEDMESNQRYSVIWKVGSLLSENRNICLTPSQIDR